MPLHRGWGRMPLHWGWRRMLLAPLRHRGPDLDSEERCDLRPPGPQGGTEPPPWLLPLHDR